MFLHTDSSTSALASASFTGEPMYCFEESSFSRQRQPRSVACALVSGKKSIANVSLYANEHRFMGKYSPYSPDCHMCCLSLKTRSRYSGSEYCLLRMQNLPRW